MEQDLLVEGLLNIIEQCTTRGEHLHAGVVAREVAKDFFAALLAVETPEVKFRFDRELWPDGGPKPVYAKAGDAAVDLVTAEDVDIAGGRSVHVRTGMHVEIPPGYEGQVRPRSGLAFNHEITVTNSPGTIDSGFRGAIIVMLSQHVSGGKLHIKRGDRIAQLVIAKVAQARFVEVDQLTETERGEAGFGSTGLR